MAFLNDNYLKLKAGYLFPEIARRVKAFGDANPEAAKRIIRCGIGDVTEPLPAAATAAMHQAIDQMATRDGFHGYGPEQGYEWLRKAIAQHDYRAKGIEVADDEIFVSDGSKCDCGNILDILGDQNKVAITDPVYPVYVDTNVMAGRTGEADESGAYAGLVYLKCTAENGFVAAPPQEHVDVIYLCFPNNPTGAVATRAQLEAWVAYAREHQSVILYDAAYESYISDPAVPHSIYEIPGARVKFAIGVSQLLQGRMAALAPARGAPSSSSGKRSWPRPLSMARASPLHPLWSRRHSTKFNGVSYVVQRGAEALYSPEGKAQIAALVAHYMGNAKILREAASSVGWRVYGGVNAPYIWVSTPAKTTSWQMFDRMLNEANVVITPGSGFGAMGEGYFRISAFNSRANAEEVARRIKTIQWVSLDRSRIRLWS